MERRRRRFIHDLIEDYLSDLERWAEEVIESTIEQPSWNCRTCTLEPLCNVFVTTNEVVVTCDLPFAQPDTVKVEPIDETAIEIRAQMKRKVYFHDFGITHRHGEFSMFHYQTRIPVDVDMSQMQTSFKKGILEIRLPRKKRYRIKVE
ncbi:MAG: Hsp20/alpha crystallin family protein [Candidatus Bathyarchaeia archaeon]